MPGAPAGSPGEPVKVSIKLLRGEIMIETYGYKIGFTSGKQARKIWDSNDPVALSLHTQIKIDRMEYFSVCDDYALGYRAGWKNE